MRTAALGQARHGFGNACGRKRIGQVITFHGQFHGAFAGFKPFRFDFQNLGKLAHRPAGVAEPAFVTGDCTLRNPRQTRERLLRVATQKTGLLQSV